MTLGSISEQRLLAPVPSLLCELLLVPEWRSDVLVRYKALLLLFSIISLLVGWLDLSFYAWFMSGDTRKFGLNTMASMGRCDPIVYLNCGDIPI